MYKITNNRHNSKGESSSIKDYYTNYLCGDGNPKAYAGFGTTLSAYGFDLTASFLYSLGGKAYDTGYSRLISPLRLSTMPGEPRTLLTNMPDIWGMPWPTVPSPTST